jgi:hypothetical protein
MDVEELVSKLNALASSAMHEPFAVLEVRTFLKQLETNREKSQWTGKVESRG